MSDQESTLTKRRPRRKRVGVVTSDRGDKTIRVQTSSFLEAYLAFRALAGFTGLATQRMLVNAIREEEGGPDLLQQVQDRLRRAGVRVSRTERSFEPTGTELRRGYGNHGYR